MASLLFSTARIEAESKEGMSSGTGFVFAYRKTTNNPNLGMPFLVTNRHVVEGAHSARFIFLKAADERLGAALLGQPFSFTLIDLPEHCIFHPNPSVDLCAFFLVPYLAQAWRERRVRPFFRAIGTDMISEDGATIDAVETVHMVGYPSGIMDEYHLLPIIRRGITATPYGIPYENRNEFLVDISVFPGSSGSPVMLMDPGNEKARRSYFLGVLSSGFFRTTQNVVERAPAPTQARMVSRGSEMLDLGLAIRSHCVTELVETWLTERNPKMPETYGNAEDSPLAEGKAPDI